MSRIRRAGRCSIWLLLLSTLVLTGCAVYISDEARRQFRSLDGPFTVTVFPVNVVKGNSLEHDAGLADKVATFLRQEDLAEPVVGTKAAVFPVKWRASQPDMAKESALAFASVVKETGIRTDYALLVEIICNVPETNVKRVHYYLSDPAGMIADGGIRNSKWKEFHEVQPRDRQGGYEVAIRALRIEWTQGD